MEFAFLGRGWVATVATLVELLAKKSVATLTNDHRLLTRFWGHEEYRKEIQVLVRQRGVVCPVNAPALSG